MALFIKASLSQNQFSDSTIVDTTDTIIVITPICDQKYHNQQQEINFYLEQILKAFGIKDTL